ncbi:unnamed protein product [Adineta steineri]|uniref:F-box domain-containing protein n=1 Tax=Adineta steineri TaxID=433720 RepID=A0A814BFD4_9BILA|nr:unnamed protein product [Adineta steineri]CAF3781583.1 unnamed protein product [Adineta steineri]
MFNINHSGIESFPVELWREIFDYFDANDLWYSFRGLNKQIDGIINQIELHFNFEKTGNYDYFLKNIFPSTNVLSIRSLKIRKEKKIKHFFSIYSLNSLVQLRLLSLDGMYCTNDNLFTFWNQLSSLKYLRSLKIIFGSKYHPNNDLKDKEFLICSIFNQYFCPLLTCFTIENKGNDNLNTELPIASLIQTIKPTNIKYLSIDCLNFVDLIKLLPALQNAKSFSIENGLFSDNQSHPQQIVTITEPLMSECRTLDLVLSVDITFEHIEYILKHTPNLKRLILSCYWFPLLDAKKWELLLSTQCPSLVEFELGCNGDDDDNAYEKAGRVFDKRCKTRTFWKKRNAIVITTAYAEDDYYYTTVVFNLEKGKGNDYYWRFLDEMDTTDAPY